jgi:hypothetical protein
MKQYYEVQFDQGLKNRYQVIRSIDVNKCVKNQTFQHGNHIAAYKLLATITGDEKSQNAHSYQF